MSHASAERLMETVVANGYCIGCGACAWAARPELRVELDAEGRLQAVRDSAAAVGSDVDLESICPFGANAHDEDALAGPRFGEYCQHDARIGHYHSVWAGHVTEGGYRERGSSGGMGSWVLTELMSQGLVDAVVHVRPRQRTPDDPRLFAYAVSRNVEEVARGAKSHYYPTEMSRALREVEEQPGRYAVVGIPCFLKAVRLLARVRPVLEERVAFCLGLVCGHLKTARYAECLAWQCGVHPSFLERFDFRVKLPGAGADEYGVRAEGVSGGEQIARTAPARSLYGTNWGWGLFKYKACDFCDDVFAETADLTIGDAWLPQYAWDPGGTNIVIVRNRELDGLLEAGCGRNAVALEPLSLADVVRSQAAGLFHRREGLAYRLHLAGEEERWRPPKRVKPGHEHLNRRERRKHALRPRLSQQSHGSFQEALAADDLDLFQRRMAPLLAEYLRVVNPPLTRFLGAGRGLVRRCLRLGRRVARGARPGAR